MERECYWYDEHGVCVNPQARGDNEICDIEPEECMEDGFKWDDEVSQ